MPPIEDLERTLAIRTAPTLLGEKPAELLTVQGERGAVQSRIAEFNAKAAQSGLHIEELKRLKDRTLILLYNERALRKHLAKAEIGRMLRGYGYRGDKGCAGYFERLRSRMETGGDFPHEVGLFLGYPPKDIKGFIDKKGRDHLLCGYWKVYSEPENALRIFSRYDSCKKYMADCLAGGKDIYSVLKIR